MHKPDLFLSRATECESMAKLARDPESRATWMIMAARWQRCAQIDVHASSIAHQDTAVRRRKQPGWARH